MLCLVKQTGDREGKTIRNKSYLQCPQPVNYQSGGQSYLCNEIFISQFLFCEVRVTHLVSTYLITLRENHHDISLNSIGFNGEVRPTWDYLQIGMCKVYMSLCGHEFFSAVEVLVWRSSFHIVLQKRRNFQSPWHLCSTLHAPFGWLTEN